jgi:hypothetical protein
VVAKRRRRKLSNQQFALKPQDLYVLLALLVRQAKGTTYPQLSAQTGLAPSAVHGALKRAAAAGLALFQDRRPVVLKPQLREFVLAGAKYAFPAVHGRLTRGVPTAYAAAPVRVTFDVDLVARVPALAAYHGIEKEFVRLGFSRDTTSDAPICRKLGRSTGSIRPAQESR